jgi:hypothetical protein
MAINTTLHWLVSQTMFVVQIFGSEITDSKFYINHSPLAMMSIIGVASSILVLGITIYYFVPRTSSMPLRVVPNWYPRAARDCLGHFQGVECMGRYFNNERISGRICGKYLADDRWGNLS